MGDFVANLKNVFASFDAVDALLIVLFALVLRVNWSSSTDVLAKVVIPCIIALNIPIFALSFYLFTK